MVSGVCIGISEQSTVDTGRPIAHREVRGVVASNWPELQIMYLNNIVFPLLQWPPTW